jgi:hypothetical protein
MARCEVIQIQCDRCKRVETRAPIPPKEIPDLRLIFLGETVEYQDICARCTETLERIVTSIKEWEREVKQQFGPSVDGNSAPPLQVAPNYVPAQPHAAGAKR